MLTIRLRAVSGRPGRPTLAPVSSTVTAAALLACTEVPPSLDHSRVGQAAASGSLGRLTDQLDGRLGGWLDRGLDRGLDIWLDGRLDGRLDRRLDGMLSG